MRDAHTVISALHHAINALEISARHGLVQLQTALLRDDLAPHPDDVPDLRLIMMLDASVLRRLANEIDASRREIESNAIVYLNAAE